MAIDSTTITVGKTRLLWAFYHGERSGIKLHVSFTNSTKMPLKVMETTDLKHDGPVSLNFEDKRFILVADRAYFSMDKVDRHVQTGQDFIIRLKANIHLNRGRKAMDAIGIIPVYKGIAVQDAWQAYFPYTNCQHAD